MGGLAGMIESDAVKLVELPALIAEHERNAAVLAAAVGRFDAAGDYGTDGSVTMQAWLRANCRMSDGDARALVKQGRFLHRHDAMRTAACDSTLSAGQVAAFRSNTTAVTEPFLDESAELLIGAARDLDVRRTEALAQGWRQRVEAVADAPEPKLPERQLVSQRAGDGALVGRFVLTPQGALQFEQAIATAATFGGTDDRRTTSERQADALVDVCAFYNANHDKPGRPRHRPHIQVTLTAESLVTAQGSSTVDGAVVDPVTTATLLCDSVIQRLVTQAEVPLSIGRASRVVPVDLFAALAQRDRGCRYPGCDRPVRYCDAHHVKFWHHGGHTALDNLALLCNRHHHLIHQGGWQVKLLPDATLHVTAPTGRVLTSHPPGRAVLQI